MYPVSKISQIYGLENLTNFSKFLAISKFIIFVFQNFPIFATHNAKFCHQIFLVMWCSHEVFLLLGIQVIQVLLQQEGVDNISSINPLAIVSNYHVDLV